MIAKVLDAAAGMATDAALAKVKDGLLRFDNDHRFLAAVAADREQILWTLLEVTIAVARAVCGQKLDGEQAIQALLAMATDPTTVRRFRALLNEAAASTDERIAMLAVGYFVGASDPSLRDRLDWALRGLFPADADVLGHVVEQSARVAKGAQLSAFEIEGVTDDEWILTTHVFTDGIQVPQGPRVEVSSLRALAAAQCIQLSAVTTPNTMAMKGRARREWPHSLRALPLGCELHRILGTVEWREIARRRGAA